MPIIYKDMIEDVVERIRFTSPTRNHLGAEFHKTSKEVFKVSYPLLSH